MEKVPLIYRKGGVWITKPQVTMRKTAIFAKHQVANKRKSQVTCLKSEDYLHMEERKTILF